MQKELSDSEIAHIELRVANGVEPAELGFRRVEDLYHVTRQSLLAKNPDTRGFAMNILCFLDRELAFHDLVGMLDDSDDAVRVGAVKHLCSYGTRALPLLVPLLQSDPCPDVRTVIASYCGQCGGIDLVAALRFVAETDHADDVQAYRVSAVALDAIELILARNAQ